MKKLVAGEVYKNTYRGNTEIQNAINQQLSQDIGVIAPDHLETALITLRNKSKTSYYPLLSEALTLFETRGIIRLFNLSSANAGRSRIPTTMPYFIGMGRNRFKEMDNIGNKKDVTVFVNMYRIGNWSADESTYNGVSPLTDLYTCLESGVIGYKLLVQQMADKVFSDKNVLEHLIKVYTHMFSLAMTKTKTTYSGSEFQTDAAFFVIARFLLLNILEKNDSDIVDDYAYLAVKNRSSLSSLKSFEEISMIDYNSLSGFLKTFGEAFYNGEAVDLASFENKWLSLYGDATGLAIEFIPYLLHFLFAAFHSATLGGTSRMLKQKDELNKIGLSKLYAAVINALR